MKLALFDLDHTLLPIDSDHTWGEYTMSIGWRDPVEFKRANNAFYEQYKAGTINPDEYLRFATAAIVQQGAAKSIAAHDHFMLTLVEKNIKQTVLDLLQRHRDAGDTLVLVTATNEFVTRPIAKRLGIDNLIAVELEKDASGWYTGAAKGVLSFGAGKVTRVDQWLAQQGKAWADVQSSVFYSDSINDLPLLERVHRPVATNPDARLRAIATERGWPILELFA
jgi:HAD superfamily hydrolase (TIGR01490 family)